MFLVDLDCNTQNTINWVAYEKHTFISDSVRLNDQQIIYTAQVFPHTMPSDHPVAKGQGSSSGPFYEDINHFYTDFRVTRDVNIFVLIHTIILAYAQGLLYSLFLDSRTLETTSLA